MNLGFTKMHGLGNDFIVIDNFNGRITLSEEQVRFLCDRQKGIGADGVILVESYEDAHCFMNYYNADGSLAEMCGNGVRCVAKFLKDDFFKDRTKLRIATRAGIKEVECLEDGTFSVNMGKPVFSHTDFPMKPLTLEGLELHFVSMGNPHAVTFVPDVSTYDLAKLGPLIETDPHFPNKINFHIVEKKGNDTFKMKTWERGCGITLACGSGACAVYALTRTEQGANKEVTLELPGGILSMSENDHGDILMCGEAKSVYTGIVYVA